MAFRRTLPVAARARGSLRRKPAAVPLSIPFAASWPCGVTAATSPARPALDRTDAKHQYFLMADVPFDTLAVTRGLEARGFETGQAEAITEAVRAGVTGGVATKADLSSAATELRGELAELRTELKGEITELRTELRGEIAELRTELKGEIAELRTELKWIKVIGAAILAVLILPWLAELISATMPGP